MAKPRARTTGCTFCRLLQGPGPPALVTEERLWAAFLDHRPLFPGHCLVVPREHHETLADLPEGLVGPVFAGVRLLARAVEEAMQAEGTFVAVNNRVSQSVPHLHVHVVPRRRGDGLRGFFWPRQRYADEAALGEVQARIRAAVARLRAAG